MKCQSMETFVDYDITLPWIEEDILEYDIEIGEDETLENGLDLSEDNMDYDISLKDDTKNMNMNSPTVPPPPFYYYYLPPVPVLSGGGR